MGLINPPAPAPSPAPPPAPKSATAKVVEMAVEFISSKKALSMIAGNAVLWSAISKAISKHEQFATVCVVGSFALTAVYIISQAYVDTHKPK